MIRERIGKVIPEARWWLGVVAAAAFGIVRIAKEVARATARAVRGLVRFSPLRSAVLVVVAAAGLAFLALLVDATCFMPVPHGFVGVKQVDVGDRGITERDYPPGFFLRLPVLESGHLIDTKLQVLTFGGVPGNAPWLEVRTSEGDVVHVGASLVYRVRKDEAWKLVADGLKGAWKHRVQATAEAMFPRELGRLSAVEIATSETRYACAERLQAGMDEALASEHVEVLSVLVSEVRFGPEYEKKLQAKQLAVQQERLREAAAEADALRARNELAEQEIENSTRAIVAEWDARIAERAAIGKSEIAAIRTETKFYSDTRRAAGTAEHDRLVMAGERAMTQAVALKDSLMRKALAGGSGRYWLAQKAAENLNIRQVTLDPGDPGVPSVLDLDQMVRMLVGVDPGPSRSSIPR
ncbi:MAG: SPFH domain-containing protein [Planctomycetota bacterium]